MQTRFNDIDGLKALIYEDFLRSIAAVRAGQSSELAFFEHERRVHALRLRVAAAEARPALRLVS